MKRLSMNRNQIKYLAILAMTVDHVAWAFVPTASWQGQLMHFFGRLTGPSMAYFLAEGYARTRSVGRYALRLALFAALSWAPFSLFETGRWPSAHFGVIYTLLLGLLAVWLWDRAAVPVWLKVPGVAALCILSLWGDWAILDVLWPLFFFVHRGDRRRQWTAYCLLAAPVCALSLLGEGAWRWRELFQLGMFLVPVLFLTAYSGESGSRHPFHKWFFYVFYPAHLLALTALARYLG